ncbi:MAG: tetratricopeptide repeat protein [Flavobacteriales bacterium]|nr:tetratricopeptide repeat protein [Flavobacteriales bacterium]
MNPQSTDALYWRSKAYAAQKEYAKAIDDISRCVALGRVDRPVYLQRARYYHGYGQHQNAVNDLNRILLENPKDVDVLLLRAECKEANLDMDGALKDLENAQKEMEGNTAYHRRSQAHRGIPRTHRPPGLRDEPRERPTAPHRGGTLQPR